MKREFPFSMVVNVNTRLDHHEWSKVLIAPVKIFDYEMN